LPLIQVDLSAAVYDELHEQLSAEIQAAQVEALGITPDDLFHVFRPHQPGEMKFDPGYNNVDRRDLVLIHITMVHMYPVSKKRALFEAIVRRLGALGIRSEDILISVAENGFEDWYAGR
jgi:Tautomerase enzyme